jgi:hypothetical protein
MKNTCAFIIVLGSFYSALCMEINKENKASVKALDSDLPKNLPLVAKLQDTEITKSFGKDAARIIHARCQALRNKIDTNSKNIRSKNSTDLRSIDTSFVYNFQAGFLISVLGGVKPKSITEMHLYHKKLFLEYPHIVLIDKFETPIMRAYKVDQKSDEILDNLKFDFDLEPIARDLAKIRTRINLGSSAQEIQTSTQQDGKSPRSEQ